MKSKRYLCLVPIPLIASFLLQMLVGGVYSFFSQKSSGLYLFVIGFVCAVFFTFCFYKNFPNKGTPFLHKVFSLKNMILLVLSGIIFQISLAFALEIILPFIPGASEYYQNTTGVLFQKNFFSVLYVCLLAPIAEEMIFRGLTFQFAKKAVSLMLANMIQAGLFAIYHMNLVQGIYAGLMGLVLGYIVIKMKSIWAAVLLHSAINICGLLLDVFISDTSVITLLEKGLVEVLALTLVCLLIREIPTIKE